MNLEPIANDSIVNEVFKRISQSILSGELKPGGKLPTEMELVEKLSVGRNSVREAVKMLSAMGVLEVRRGQGTFVATEVGPAVFNPLIFSLIIESKTSDDLYELRIMFESMVMLVAIDKITPDDLARIEDILVAVQDMHEAGGHDIDEFVEKDIEFHLEILGATRNPLIQVIGKTITELFPSYIRRSLLQEHGVQRMLRNHREILELLRRGERSLVFDTVERTLLEWKQQWR